MEGWTTDRGRIYVVYGPPNSIAKEPQVGEKFPSEVWTYVHMLGVGENVSLEFERGYHSGSYWHWFDRAIPGQIRIDERIVLPYDPADHDRYFSTRLRNTIHLRSHQTSFAPTGRKFGIPHKSVPSRCCHCEICLPI